MLKEPALNSAAQGSTPEVRAAVEGVIAGIRERGDAAVREYSRTADKYAPESFRLNQEQLDEIIARVPEQTIEDIRFVQDQVRVMAQKQLESLADFEIETLPGVFLGQKNVPAMDSRAPYCLGLGAYRSSSRMSPNGTSGASSTANFE